MDDLYDFMARSDAALSEFGARISALENVLASLPGVGLESDPTKLPVVVFENTNGMVTDGNN